MVLELILLYKQGNPGIPMGIRWPGPAPISTDGATVPA